YADGRVASSIRTIRLSTGKDLETDRTFWVWDGDRLLSLDRVSSPGGWLDRTVYFYDVEGRLERRERWAGPSEASLIHREWESYTYDGGRVHARAGARFSDGEWERLSESLYGYDDAGRLTGERIDIPKHSSNWYSRSE